MMNDAVTIPSTEQKRLTDAEHWLIENAFPSMVIGRESQLARTIERIIADREAKVLLALAQEIRVEILKTAQTPNEVWRFGAVIEQFVQRSRTGGES